MALRNLRRNLRRSLSTGLAMTAGFVGLILLSAYILRVQRGLEASTVYLNFKGHVSIFKKDSLDRFSTKPAKFILTSKDQEVLKKYLVNFADEIDYTGDFLSGSGLLSFGSRTTPFIAMGFEPEVYFKSHTHPFLLKWAKDWIANKESLHDEFLKYENLISITLGMSDILGLKKLTLDVPENEREIQIAGKSYFGDLNVVNAAIGTYHSTGISLAEDTSLIAPLKVLQNLYETSGIQYRALFLRNSVWSSQIASKLNKLFQDNQLPYEAYPFTDEKVSYFYVGTMGFLYVMGGFFVLLICSAVVLSIINSMTMGILERTKEIGTLKALGFNSRFITELFVKEAFWLSLMSLVVGIFISSLISFVVNHLNIRFTPPGVAGDVQFMLATEPVLVAPLSLFFILISVVTSYFVVKNKAKTKLIELLSDSGA